MGTLTGVRTPTRIRFVGGCWHNMLPLMKSLPAMIATLDGVHVYYLGEFETYWGTRYWQYVHESHVGEGTVDACVCREKFPVWRINIPQLQAKIRVRLKQSWKQN